MRKVKDWYELYPRGKLHFKDGDRVRVLWLSNNSQEVLEELSRIIFTVRSDGYYLHPSDEAAFRLIKDRLVGCGVVEDTLYITFENRVFKLSDLGVRYKNKRRSA